MNYDNNKDYQSKTGAFYTPKVWADKAVEYIRKFCGDSVFNDYLFYDPAAGEGALLDALPKGTRCFASTLEQADVEILRAKGYDAVQLDFFNDAIPYHLQCAGNVIVLMNPPYFKAQKTNMGLAAERYGTNDSVSIFYHRILKELGPAFLFSFNKLDLFYSAKMREMRLDLWLTEQFMGGFLTNSHTWGLKGQFPIAFCCYKIGYMTGRFNQCDSYIEFDVFGHEKPTHKVWLQ